VTTVWRWSGDGVVALHFAYLAYLLVGVDLLNTDVTLI